MQVVVAEPAAYIETVKRYAGTAVAVFPYGLNWSSIIKSGDVLQALLTHQPERLPTDPAECS